VPDDEINEIADRMARKLLQIGDDSMLKKRAWRIQFKLGDHGNEIDGGGLSLIGLKLELAKLLKQEAEAGHIA
jgi:hypothetical protein